MANVFTKIIKWSIYLLVFLLPLFWLPFSFVSFEFNKQYLMAFLVSLAFFCWLAKMVLVDKEIKFKRTPLDIFVAAFIFIAIISMIFSADRGSSISGSYGRFSNGLMGLLSLGMLYFLITNNVKPLIDADKKPINADKKISVSGLVKTFMWSAFFVVLASYFSILGIWAKLGGILPQIMLQKGFNPVSGTTGGLAIFLAVVLVLLTVMISLEKRKSKVLLVTCYLSLLAILFLLLVINFWASWVVILTVMALFVGLALRQRVFKEMAGKLALPVLLMIMTGVFIIFNFQFSIFNLQLGREPVLNQGVSWQIGLESATDNIKSGFFGSGVGTYFYDFSKFKPAEFNANSLWQIRFDRAGNHISEILGTMGFLGFLSYLAMVGMFLLISWFLLQAKILKPQFPISNFQFPILMMFIALFIAQFVYYQNTVLAFFFWLILGLSVVSWEAPSTGSGQGPLTEKTFSLRELPELNLIATVLLIVIGLGILTTYYFGQQRYRADMVYNKSQKMAQGKDQTALLEKAVKMNTAASQYKIALAKVYLNDAQNEIRKPTEQQDPSVIQATVAKAIDTARSATLKTPGQVSTIETLAMIYRNRRLVAAGALDWGIKSFQAAISLEPTNPVLRTELGKLLFINNPEEAKKEFSKAKELKPDYVDVLIQEALVFEKEDNLDEAVRKMEEVSLDYPFNTEVLFQLGRLYFNANRVDDSILQLEKVIELSSNHSNALYSLGVAYQKKGMKKEAISTFEKVLELNPGNQDIVKKLESLKK